MASKVNSCGYDPHGRKDFERINPLAPLQTDGDLDISYLVQEIVTKDFGYSGTSKYTLRLHNNKMVLELWNNASGTDKQKYAKIKLENDQWKRGATVLNDSRQTSNRLHHTLDRISRAYCSGQPGARAGADGSAELAATESANRGPVVNNYISCGHPACTHSIDGLQGLLQQQLRALEQRLNELERSVRNNQQPRPAQCREHVGKLEATVDSLHEKLETLQRSIDKLRNENADMKGLRQPLETMSRDVPEALREIRYQLQQLGTLLGERLSVNSNGAQSQMIREMLDGLSKMQAQLAPLAESAASLKTTNSELQRENEALKRQAVAQADKLSLKDRDVKDLNSKNRAQEEKLSRLQAELKQEKAKHSQLHNDLKKEKGKTERARKSFASVSNELEQAQKESELALAAKAKQVEELERGLLASREQNATIGQLRQQLEANNELLAAAQQENVTRQRELEAANIAHSKAQEQLETLRAELAQSRETQKRSAKKTEDLQRENDILTGHLDETTNKLTTAQAQLQEAKEQNSEDYERILTLQGINKKLSAEQASLQKKVSDQQALLASATKAAKVSEHKIEELSQSLKQKDKELEEQKRSVAAAQETAQKAQKETRALRWEFENQRSRLDEVTSDLKYTQKLLDTRSKQHAEAARALGDLQREFDELRQVSKDLEEAQDNEIKTLQAQLLSLEGKVDPALLQKEHQAEIEQLKQQIQDAQLQQKEAAQAKESSDRLYKAQKEQLERRNKELEDELLRLRDRLTLNERMLKQQTASIPTEDLRGKLPLPKTHSTSSSRIPRLPVNDSNGMNQIGQSLQNIEQAMKTLDATETVPPLWVGPIVINMAFLDERLAKDRPSWISGKFEDELDAEELKRVDKSLTVHYEPLTARAYKEKNARTVAGDLNKVMEHEAIRALKNPDYFKTLESCFSERLFIVKCLKEAKMQLEPIVAQYQTLSDSDLKRQAKFERASKLVEQIDQVLEVIGQKLNHHKWKIRA